MPQPRDYDPNATDPDFKQEWFGGTAVSGRGSVGGEGRDRRIDYLLQGLVLAGVLALVGIVWTLRDEVTKITTFVKTKAEQYDRDINRIDATLARHDERITVIERGQGSSNRIPDDRP
jgi:hypothetical protein